MNNDINIVIKSQGQPDGGEGHSAGQAVHGNVYSEEGLSANVRGDAQEPSEAILTRDESATQDKVLYSSHEEGRRLGARAWKVNEHTPPVFALWATPWSSRRIAACRAVACEGGRA